MDGVPSAFALTSGASHVLDHANAAFRALLDESALGAVGGPIATDLATRDGMPLSALLDRAFRLGAPVRNLRLDHSGLRPTELECSIWPSLGASGEVERLLIEMRRSTPTESTLALQREVAERLLLRVLREQEASARSEMNRRSASFLAEEGRRIGESLDEAVTTDAITRTRLPYVGSWCVVDLLAPDRAMHRLTVVHPDPEMQPLLDALDGRWTPRAEDEYGLPAIIRDAGITTVAVDLAALLERGTHAPEIHDALLGVGAGPSLVVPMKVGDRLMGTIMFVAPKAGHAFTEDDTRLAIELADRSAAALDRARLYSESMAQRVRAESANEAKSTFLSMMSHELRTPLNAIAGYVDLIDLELRGPVTEAQHADLDRIRTNQRYLTGLINDLLSLAKLNGGQLAYRLSDVDAHEVIEASNALLAPLILQQHLTCETSCEQGLVARADRDKVLQILVNLLSNAIKFTPAGGTLQLSCTSYDNTIEISVCDSGIGIPQDKLEHIFDPFVQLNANSLNPEAGVGLGLAISRGLARAMHGELIAEGATGGGAVLRLTLPRAAADLGA